jgi:1-deoxy-D-xylulose-5-phosphate synthase
MKTSQHLSDEIKRYSKAELQELVYKIQKFLLNNASKHGGHIGANLGVVEITIAMHYLFSLPKDKFVFDVSHQSYIHKILTGRKSLIENPKNKIATSFYSDQSEYDYFVGGLTSSSISLASGLLTGLSNNTKVGGGG